MTNTITIDDQEYSISEDLVRWFRDNPYGSFLKPISKPTEVPRHHFLELMDVNGDNLLDSKYRQPISLDLTKEQATALAEAIKALVEYVQKPELSYVNDYMPLDSAIRKALVAFNKDKER